MLTETLVHKSLQVPVVMTNLYPFLMGDAALKHEKIPRFPKSTSPKTTSWSRTAAVLSTYVQYENSDCLNGAVLRVEDGYRFVEGLPSHHAILATGDLRRRVELMAGVMGLEVQRL